MKSPSTIEGADNRMSLMKRIVSPISRLLAYSARYVPAPTPIGVPIRIAISDMIALPKKALSRPPSEPGGGVISVNNAGLIALMPLISAVHKIQTSQNNPKIVAATASVSAIAFLMRRRVYNASIVAMSVALLPGQAHQHPFRDGEHDEGDDEQQEAERDQRGAVQIRVGFGEFVGERRRDGVARHQQRRREQVRVA